MFIYYAEENGNAKYGDIYHEIKEIIKYGDILLVKRYGKLNNIFLPTFYTHSGIYIGDSKEYGKERIIHSMTPDGVQITDLISYIETNELTIVRPELGEEEINKAISNAINLCGKKFDYNFTLRDTNKKYEKRYYCAELVFDSYRDSLDKLGWYPTIKKWGPIKKEGITPDDFLPNKNSRTKVIFQKRIR